MFWSAFFFLTNTEVWGLDNPDRWTINIILLLTSFKGKQGKDDTKTLNTVILFTCHPRLLLFATARSNEVCSVVFPTAWLRFVCAHVCVCERERERVFVYWVCYTSLYVVFIPHSISFSFYTSFFVGLLYLHMLVDKCFYNSWTMFWWPPVCVHIIQ